MKNSRRVLAPLAVLAFLSSFHAPGATGQAQDVRRAENANEARLNGLQPPDLVMDAIGLEPGMVIGEVGAGRGRYAVQLAARVGETSKVYANDIDGVALQYLEYRSKEEK